MRNAGSSSRTSTSRKNRSAKGSSKRSDERYTYVEGSAVRKLQTAPAKKEKTQK